MCMVDMCHKSALITVKRSCVAGLSKLTCVADYIVVKEKSLDLSEKLNIGFHNGECKIALGCRLTH